ncbi:UDP-GalNAc:beta-1,3-N-acetylgalactosaminyltransferase 2-like [Ischnura elegans]|uniref:UDP-GalNAc:beta-1, 3-N-acetylgalactosaminyltransferase 2-like n=1 Tax=Ischnura elegans TaxID=197161 RepID=UPI001ED8A8A0|nr:UDP-GalNAc:beta-1,3-N-acetylgalactosaminyltransferase 2-like [Ischnura elegans]
MQLTIVFACVLAILTSYILSLNEKICGLVKGIFLPQQSLLFVIGIMSAQSNFELRRSIRDTWLNELKPENMEYVFIVGEKFCSIPPEDRISPYECREQKFNLLNGVTEKSEFTAGRFRQSDCVNCDKFLGFSFVVNHPIVIRRLSALKELVERYNGLKVSLLDSATKQSIVSTRFDRSNMTDSPITSQVIDEFVLPKGYEGQIIVENEEFVPEFDCKLEMYDQSGVVRFLQLLPTFDLKPIAFYNSSCTPVTMVYSIYELEELQSHIISKPKRLSTWRKKVMDQKYMLAEEVNERKDILLVKTIDTYRNIPDKLLYFMKWASKRKKFHYILKTDDDTFVDLKKVEKSLVYTHMTTSFLFEHAHFNWWWSSFRVWWPVDSFGKWREDEYRSSTYPPFPCGAGYVLSKDLVHYIADNSPRLHRFQGEDVSVGIWLAGLLPKTSETGLGCIWSCSLNETQVCSNLCNRPQLTVNEMYATWVSFKKCGNMCGC